MIATTLVVFLYAAWKMNICLILIVLLIFLSEATTGIFLCFFFCLFWGQLHFLSYFTIIFLFCGFPCGSAGKEATCNVGDLGSILGFRRSLEKFQKVYPLQYSGLDNSMDFIVHGVAKNWTQLSCFHFAFQRSRALETEPDNVKNERINTWIYTKTSIN